MSAELIAMAILNSPPVTAIVGNKIAATRLKPNTKPPALVYQAISTVHVPNVNYREPVIVRSRIQINPLALKPDEIHAINEAVKSVLNFKFRIVAAGKTVLSSRLDLQGPMEKDDETGIWTQSTDYILQFYE